MMDALLLAVEQAILDPTTKLGYDKRFCAIMPDEKPQPRCDDVFISIYEGPISSGSVNSLDERFAFNLCLTMRVTVPLDRIGDALLARRLAKKVGFNARSQVLKTFLHQNWSVLGIANNLLIELNPDATLIYGFVEPARFAGMDRPVLVGGDHFQADPQNQDTGLKAELRFEGARRMQPIGSYV